MRRKKLNKYSTWRHTHSGWTLLKNELDIQTRTAMVLRVLGGYPMAEAYRMAFNFKGKPSSLAPIASRWWNDPEIKDYFFIFCFNC
ncbi:MULTISPECIES: hypothetical protein [Parabacteroides]|uniref:Uncharacterized protein n=1 Tax=Parabacteroides faecis TaxID=1217282 RepID=A0ABR6KRL7_9BACT|nr:MULTISPECIES: hypothetical protein [Parabacteroides]MBB4624152.1 hypothetical protein [Parabacteroides faecis]MBC8620674.1 hypothetical protein [Parabacteroides faecis]RHR93411.1 hypothetical protein DWW23_21575 [Parabacteroides sp. AF14-59]